MNKKRLSQILAIAAVVISISGCKGTREVVREVPVYVHDTTYQSSVQHDSVYIHDSVHVYMNGDTLYITRDHTRYIEREKHDTIYLSTEIPIDEIRTEVREVEVEKPLRWWQKVLQWMGCLVVVAGMGFVMAWYVNRRC